MAAAMGVLIALEMAAVLMGGFRLLVPPAEVALSGPAANNTLQLWKLIYTEYIIPLEVAAAILLVAMIAAIALTLRVRKDSKYVSPGDQVRVKAKDRMSVLQMDATRAASPEVATGQQPETKP